MTNENIRFTDSASLEQTILDLHNIKAQTYEKSSVSYHGVLRRLSIEKGLQTKVPKQKHTNIYWNKELVGKMRRLRPGTTHKDSNKICGNKWIAENYLKQFDIKTTNSKMFRESEKSEAYEFVKNNSDKGLLIKPLTLNSGTGIEFNVNEKTFDNKWENSLKAQKTYFNKDIKCLIQELTTGFDIRIAITEGVFSSATLRLPAHIVGDGSNSVDTIIDEKNELRKQNPYLKSKLILKDDELLRCLKKHDYHLNSIPKSGEVIILQEISNLTSGGESVDISHVISSKVVDNCLKAVASIPGLSTAGVDILTPDFINDSGIILEINASANFNLNYFTYKGEGIHPLDQWLDLMLIKHKLRTGRPLNENEFKQAANIFKFNDLKAHYFATFSSRDRDFWLNY